MIQLSEKEKIEPIVESEPTSTTPSETKEVAYKKRFPWGRVAAALIVLPMAFYSYWIPFETDVFHTGYVSFQDFNPLKNKTERVYDIREDQKTVQYKASETFDLDEEIAKIPETVNYYSLEINKNLYIPIDLGRANTSSDSNTSSVKYAPLHLIVGCFADHQNAVDYVADLKQAGFKKCFNCR